MARICPDTGEKVTYLVCQDCDDRLMCLSKNKRETVLETGTKTAIHKEQHGNVR